MTEPAPAYLTMLDVLERMKRGEFIGRKPDGNGGARYFLTGAAGGEVAPSTWRNLKASGSVESAKSGSFRSRGFDRLFSLVTKIKPKEGAPRRRR